MQRGGHLCWVGPLLCAERIEGGPCVHCAEWSYSSMLPSEKEIAKEAPVSLHQEEEAPIGEEAHCAEWSYSSMLRGLREAPMPIRGPCAAERRPMCRREEAPVSPRERPMVLCERRPSVPEGTSVLRGLEEAPVSGGPKRAERRPSVPGGSLC